MLDMLKVNTLLIAMLSLTVVYGQTTSLGSLKSLNDFKESYIPLLSRYEIKTAEVKSGQGLYQALKDVGLENAMSLEIINTLRDEVEFSKLKLGDKLQAKYNEHNELVEFMYSQVPSDKHIVRWNAKKASWDYVFKEERTHWYSRIISGELKKGSTLQADLLAKGLEPQVVNEIVQVLLCKVNFRMYARMGDKYDVLLSERLFNKKIIGTKVLYTSYSGRKAGNYKAYYYEDAEKGSTYSAHYTASGQALINAGLRYPLKRLHVRSTFGWRRHPVTGRKAMHRGVDLRGRTGAPVYAVASGKVIISTYNKYAGNKIGIRHKDGSSSYYYHLKRRGVRKGQWVRTHELIGNVGSTGRVTGPHLHFGFKTRRGKWMNPLNKRMIATPKLKGKRFEALTAQVAGLNGLLVDLEVSKVAKYLVERIPNLRDESSFDWLNVFSFTAHASSLKDD